MTITATNTREPSTRRTKSSKNQTATASPPTAGEVVLQALLAQTRALREAERKVRDGDPKGVTKMRVAIRQLRSILRGFSRILDRQVTRPVCAELAWLGRQLGEENDTQRTLIELKRQHDALPSELIVGPVVDDARTQLDQLAVSSSQTTHATLDSDRYAALRQVLDWPPADPPFTERAARPAAEELPKSIAKALRTLDRHLVAAQALPAGTERDEALHDARKADKQLRYVIDVATPVRRQTRPAAGPAGQEAPGPARRLPGRGRDPPSGAGARFRRVGQRSSDQHVLPGGRSRAGPHRPCSGEASAPAKQPLRRGGLAAQRRLPPVRPGDVSRADRERELKRTRAANLSVTGGRRARRRRASARSQPTTKARQLRPRRGPDPATRLESVGCSRWVIALLEHVFEDTTSRR